MNFFHKMFLYKLQFKYYLYDAVNWKNNLSFNFLRTVDFKALKKCIFEKNNLTDFENRPNTQLNANSNAL